MTASPYVIEVTQSTYERMVLAKSSDVPVLVDFWADWCGPCQMQLPILLKLAEEYQGKFVLAKVDTDAERDLAALHDIRSIPTMKLFRDGAVVEEILGAQTESTLRTLLDKYVARASDTVREEALELATSGNVDAAIVRLRNAAQSDPDNPRVQLDYLRLTLEAGLVGDAEQVLGAMPRELRESPEVRRYAALIGFAGRVGAAPARAELERRVAADADDLEARDVLAARLALAGDAEGALEQYL